MSLNRLNKEDFIKMANDIIKEKPKNKKLISELKQFIKDSPKNYELLSVDWILNAYNIYVIPPKKSSYNEIHIRAYK